MTWQVPRMWEGGRCIVIGGGPSILAQFDIPPELVAKARDVSDPTGPEAYSPYMVSIHNEHVIVVNNGYQLGLWPDICFFGDFGWYMVHRLALAQWSGLKIAAFGNIKPEVNVDGVKQLHRDRDCKVGLSENPRRLAWGFNSGSSAINLAFHLGARQIILLGFDMHHEPGNTHWHQGHGNERRIGPNYAKWMQGLAIMAKDSIRLGVEIINCSPGSAIKDFPVANLKGVLGQ